MPRRVDVRLQADGEAGDSRSEDADLALRGPWSDTRSSIGPDQGPSLALVRSAPGDPPDVIVPDAVVTEIAVWIGEFQRRSGFEFVCGVAQRVIDGFFGGDMGEWRRRRSESKSIRALAAKLEGLDVMSPTTLYRYLAVYELLERVGGVSSLPRVAPSHVYAVLPVKDPALQEALLRQSDANGWSKRELEDRVAQGREAKKAAPRTEGAHATVELLAREAANLLRQLRAGEGLEDRASRETVFRRIMETRAVLESAQKLAHPKRRARDPGTS